MAPTIVNLRPSRHLLNHDFEGYKLNPQGLPHWAHNLNVTIDRLFPSDDQYSFLHAKLFALHNHLVADYWDHRYCFYYIDKNQQVRRIYFDVDSHSFENIIVYDIPEHIQRESGPFNACLSFPTQNLALISDGKGYLHIAASEGRSRSTQNWKTLHSALVLGDEKYFIIMDSRAEEKNDSLKIHCLLQSVEQTDQHFYSVLSWITFQKEGNIWNQISFKQLQGKGTIHYAAIETGFSAVYIASDHQFKFTADSENEIKNDPEKLVPKKIMYTWLQTGEDITVTTKLPQDFQKQLLQVKVDTQQLKVNYSGTSLIDGKFTNKIDNDLTTWNVQENGQVDILLTKADSTIWRELLQCGDANGEQILDASLVEEVHQKLAHLCSETEVTGSDQSVPGYSTQELGECDAASEEDTILARLDSTTHQISHRIPLSVHQYLFSITVDPRDVPAIALRHDVDTCIWQPYSKLVNSDVWPLKHLGTLNAFGYIQSSKQDRKFVTCAPDFSYSVVCESFRHLFVYKNSSDRDCELRNRSGGVSKPVHIGHQRVFNTLGEVLGIHATNNYLFMLNQQSLVAIEMI